MEEPAAVDSSVEVVSARVGLAALVKRWLGPLLSVVLLFFALWALLHMAHTVNYRDVRVYFHHLSNHQILLAVLFTAAGYTVMTLYDRFGLEAIGKSLPPGQVGLIAFISYAFSNMLGMALLVSGSIRYRFYVQAGLSNAEIAKVIFYCTVAFWLGLCTLTGITLLIVPVPPGLPMASIGWLLGVALLCLPLVWLLGRLLFRRAVGVGRWRIMLPSPRQALRQIGIGALDWWLAAAVLYLLMPEAIAEGFGHFLVIFVLAQMLGLVSHVPGGLGVFETVMLAGYGVAGGQKELAAPVLGALAAYRMIYYLLPLCVAMVLVVLREAGALRQRALLTPWFTSLLPPVFAGLTMVSGAVLLFSGATLGLPGRMELLRDFLPLPVLEVSHFMTSVIGMLLLILARGLLRRLDAAYILTLVLLVAGAVFSLLKGIDFEEASLLLLLALALAPAHRQFYRRASLFSTSFSVGWIAAIVAVLVCAIWLVFFSYKHVEYGKSLWWEFSFHHGGAPRALRALVGAAAVGLLFALARLIRTERPRPKVPSEREIAQALPLVKQFPSTQAHLALMGDKTLLFDSQQRAFVMYAVEGRSWVAMGDPVGADEEARRELVWSFRELSERAGGWPVFYQVRPEDLDLYLEVGMRLLKIGEEARVPLAKFNLDGKSKKVLRNTINKLEREGLRLEIVPTERVPELMPRLKAISDAWMGDKRVREKRFSLGAFDPAYLMRTPVAVVWQGGQVVAFANLFLNDTKEEASVDLMRHLPDGLGGIMDYLFVTLMQWSKAQGYRWFNLGMAPLSGLQNRRLAPLWMRFGALVFGRGERFYNFRGLHRYKDKFDPQWEPRYIAVSAGVTLPLALANVASLIAGGLAGVVRR